MTLEEFKAIEKVWELKHKEELILWRKSAYYAAAHFFDFKNKKIPEIEEWHPFPFDEIPDKSEQWVPYDDRIEFARKIGKEEWIMDEWYQKSSKYKA